VPYFRNVSPHGMIGPSLPQPRKLFDKDTYYLAEEVAYARQLDRARPGAVPAHPG
jgi:hypothetical protein